MQGRLGACAALHAICEAAGSEFSLRPCPARSAALRCEPGCARAEALAELPESAEECDEAAAERRSRAQRMAVGDRGVLERYTALTKACDKAAADKQAKDAEVATLQARASPALRIVQHNCFGCRVCDEYCC